MNIFNHPERIYNIEKKGCRLSLRHQPGVLEKKGTRRVHIGANQQGENVTIVVRLLVHQYLL